MAVVTTSTPTPTPTGLPLPRPRPQTVPLPDGGITTANLYAMPQHETNAHDALAILLHAAHLRTDRVPRSPADFVQFVAVAEACLRYRCAQPLRVVVEHCWLPAWVHRAWAGDRPDRLLVISYAFGLPRLFARASKSAVLDVVDEEELAAKRLPRTVKER